MTFQRLYYNTFDSEVSKNCPDRNANENSDTETDMVLNKYLYS